MGRHLHREITGINGRLAQTDAATKQCGWRQRFERREDGRGAVVS